MHIGYDISQTGSGKAGCGYFSHAMIQTLLELAPEHHYSLYPSFGNFYFDALMPLKNPYKKGRYWPRYIRREAANAFWAQNNVETLLGHPDIVHANNFWCPTQFKSSRVIYTLHDMGFLIQPDWTTERNRLGCFEGVFSASIAADWIIAVSQASRTHYLHTFPHFPEDRICVIYPCSRFHNTTTVGKKPKALAHLKAGEFWLSVGTIEPRKNQIHLANAYARYLELHEKPMPLVFAGGKGWLMDHFQKHLQELKVEAQVILTGYVSDAELIWLYQHCYANLYPSLFEGFGLPVLEGMQFGTPTLSSHVASLPEITANAAILLPPDDLEAWAQAMFRLAQNPQERTNLSVASIQRAQQFNRERSASQLLQLYIDAVAQPKRVAQL